MFGYHAQIIETFPTIRAGVIHAVGVENGPASPDLTDEYRAQQRATRKALEGVSLADTSSIAAWRRVFSRFGVKPTQYRNAGEALLRRLTKQADIPSLNRLVDIGNLVAIRYSLPVAVFDQAQVTGSTTVRFARGDESFTDLGSDTPTSPEPGEVIFADDSDLVSARRWCWRQSAQSATKASTTEVLVTVEGHHDDAAADTAAALDDLGDLFERYLPGAGLTMAR
ncbi:MAG: phenylalanine--tRNA ligase beta subunit-related protein, partial [Acidimicrobiia bacterium]